MNGLRSGRGVESQKPSPEVAVRGAQLKDLPLGKGGIPERRPLGGDYFERPRIRHRVALRLN